MLNGACVWEVVPVVSPSDIWRCTCGPCICTPPHPSNYNLFLERGGGPSKPVTTPQRVCSELAHVNMSSLAHTALTLSMVTTLSADAPDALRCARQSWRTFGLSAKHAGSWVMLSVQLWPPSGT